MTVKEKLATSQGRKDEEPNAELAKAIAAEGDEDAVKELVELLRHKDKGIQSDAMKTLYEIGAAAPSLLSDYADAFLSLIAGKNNRLAWGAMTALDAIALTIPKRLYAELPSILEAAEKGSVITRDRAVGILIKLYSLDEYAEEAFPLLLAQLRTCPANQLPMYAENVKPVVRTADGPAFAEALMDRLIGIESDSKRNRVEKVIRSAVK